MEISNQENLSLILVYSLIHNSLEISIWVYVQGNLPLEHIVHVCQESALTEPAQSTVSVEHVTRDHQGVTREQGVWLNQTRWCAFLQDRAPRGPTLQGENSVGFILIILGSHLFQLQTFSEWGNEPPVQRYR